MTSGDNKAQQVADKIELVQSLIESLLETVDGLKTPIALRLDDACSGSDSKTHCYFVRS